MFHLIIFIVIILSMLSSVSFSQSLSNTKTQSSRVFVFNPNTLTWVAYENGRIVNSGKASGGKRYCPDTGRSCKTIVGSFRVFSNKGPNCKSSRFPLETRGGSPMPYCMHFHRAGYAIHGAPTVPNMNASHGCIRVTTPAAKWLSENFIRIGTPVVVRPYRD